MSKTIDSVVVRGKAEDYEEDSRRAKESRKTSKDARESAIRLRMEFQMKVPPDEIPEVEAEHLRRHLESSVDFFNMQTGILDSSRDQWKMSHVVLVRESPTSSD